MSSLSYTEYINSVLNSKFGLGDFDLSKDIKTQFIALFNTKMPQVIKKGTVYLFSNGENKKYTHECEFSHGSYNKIQRCFYNTDNRKTTYVILRISNTEISKSHIATSKSYIIETLYSAFIDCFKTIILNIFLQKYVPEKIMPDIYNFGYCPELQEFIMCMEYINTRSDMYIRSHFVTNNIKTINSFIINIYRKLELLNSYGLQFRHGDLKYNNVLVHNGDPLFIDFGFTSFKIPETSICFDSQNIDHNVILNFHKYYEDAYDCSNSDKYNNAQDLFLFITSLYCMSCFPTENEIILLMKSSSPTVKFIIEGLYLFEYLNKKYKIKSKQDFIDKEIIFKIYYDDMSSINIARDSKNGYIDFKTITLFTYTDLLKYIDNDLPKPIIPEPVDILPETDMSIFLKTIEDATNFIDILPSNSVCSCEVIESKKTCKHIIQFYDDSEKLKKHKCDDLLDF